MLKLRNVTKSYDGVTSALAGVDLDVAGGEIVCLLGPSGCGKTTLLRIVAGLEQADAGSILLGGEDLTVIPVHQRNFGLMFQEFALFPHKSVGDNIAFGLQMAAANSRLSATQIARQVDEMLALVNLTGYANRSIFALSGGERQRVALARSLAPNPRLLMLDEPLGNLDRALREELMSDLRRILKEVGVTALYVTHDQGEGFAVADRLVVMNRGRIEQQGAPRLVYHQPANEFVARFLGFQNLVRAHTAAERDNSVQTPLGLFQLEVEPPKGQHTLLMRPQAVVQIERIVEGQARVNQLQGVLQSLSFRGGYYRAEVVAETASGEFLLIFELADRPAAVPLLEWQGEQVTLTLDPAYFTVLTA
jgi:ABC-type Fe3+/spermidine/putrescine transport system ATPase subunit